MYKWLFAFLAALAVFSAAPQKVEAQVRFRPPVVRQMRFVNPRFRVNPPTQVQFRRLQPIRNRPTTQIRFINPRFRNQPSRMAGNFRGAIFQRPLVAGTHSTRAAVVPAAATPSPAVNVAARRSLSQFSKGIQSLGR